MRAHSLAIQNFRGIKSLDWVLPPGIACLIGPGNSTKSTVLDALDLLLTSRTSVNMCDADFFDCDIAQPLSIEAVMTDLPPALASFEAYGDLHCGISAEGKLSAEPEEGYTPAIVLRFGCDETLEPIWEVVKPGREDEARAFRVGARRASGLFRVDDRIDQHLRWSRGSHLSALSGDIDGIGAVLADALRTARKAVFDADLDALAGTAAEVEKGLAGLGGEHLKNPGVGLDPHTVVSGGSLVLHDSAVPLTNEGLGVRRLASLAIQRLRTPDPSILLIDEVEYGLEPHRLLRVLRRLMLEEQRGVQIILTTHSPVVVEALPATALAIVRSASGVTAVRSVPDLLAGLASQAQGTIRHMPSAMLAQRVLLVEGATEEGVVHACCEEWDSDERNLAMGGVTYRDGGGEETLSRAECLSGLGYQVAALIDHDTDVDAPVASATQAGVEVIRCAKGLSLERHVARDLPFALLPSLIDLAIAVREEDDEGLARSAVLSQVTAKLEGGINIEDSDPSAWPVDEEAARGAIGRAASSGKGWFKTHSKGYALGRFLCDNTEALNQARGQLGPEEQADHIRSLLERVQSFLYSDLSPVSNDGPQ
jgi:putative ATP-dependent endonuclease of the OLD family